MNKITKPSKHFSILFRILFYANPTILLILWIYFDPTDTTGWIAFEVIETVSRNGKIPDIDLWQRIACFGASMVPGAAIMYVYWTLSRLFDLYARGVFFGKENVSCYRAIGYGLICQQLLFTVEEVLQTFFLTMHNLEGERMISISFDDTNASLLVVGLMIILISRIMDEGRKIQEEQSLTV